MRVQRAGWRADEGSRDQARPAAAAASRAACEAAASSRSGARAGRQQRGSARQPAAPAAGAPSPRPLHASADSPSRAARRAACAYHGCCSSSCDIGPRRCTGCSEARAHHSWTPGLLKETQTRSERETGWCKLVPSEPRGQRELGSRARLLAAASPPRVLAAIAAARPSCRKALSASSSHLIALSPLKPPLSTSIGLPQQPCAPASAARRARARVHFASVMRSPPRRPASRAEAAPFFLCGTR